MASFGIYLTHWQVYPELEAAGHQVLAAVASIFLGLLAHQTQRWISKHRGSLARPLQRDPRDPRRS